MSAPSAVSRNRWVDIRGQRDSSQAGKPAAEPAGLKPREPQKQRNIFRDHFWRGRANTGGLKIFRGWFGNGPDIAFGHFKNLGIRNDIDFGAESSRPTSSLSTLLSRRSPDERQDSLPACLLRL